METCSIIILASSLISGGGNSVFLKMMENLPPGPKAMAADCKQRHFPLGAIGQGLTCYRSPERIGSGGALLAAEDFLADCRATNLIITMGAMPFTSPRTYGRLVERLNIFDMVVLGFEPPKNKCYSLLEIEAGMVYRHIPWSYHSEYPASRQGCLTVCNTGIYAIKRKLLVQYLPMLSAWPHIVHKQTDGPMMTTEEYHISDLIKFMVADGHSVGCLIAMDEKETIGIEDAEMWHDAAIVPV